MMPKLWNNEVDAVMLWEPEALEPEPEKKYWVYHNLETEEIVVNKAYRPNMAAISVLARDENDAKSKFSIKMWGEVRRCDTCWKVLSPSDDVHKCLSAKRVMNGIASCRAHKVTSPDHKEPATYTEEETTRLVEL